jgi:hypothetical protein
MSRLSYLAQCSIQAGKAALHGISAVSGFEDRRLADHLAHLVLKR